MSPKSLYKLTLTFCFASEQFLDQAIGIFNSWCASQPETKKRYGFIRTNQVTGFFYFYSSKPLASRAESLHKALEAAGNLDLIKTKFESLA